MLTLHTEKNETLAVPTNGFYVVKQKIANVMRMLLTGIGNVDSTAPPNPIAIYREFDNRMGELQRALESYDREYFLNLFGEIAESGDWSLEHPLRKGRETRCVENIRVNMSNVLIFRGSKVSDTWMLLQRTGFADRLWADNGIYSILRSGQNKPSFAEDFALARERSEDVEVAVAGFGGLIFSQIRPYHFFYDQLINYQDLKAVLASDTPFYSDDNCFFGRQFFDELPKKKGGWYIFPTISAGLKSERNDLQQFKVNAQSLESLVLDCTPCGEQLPECDFALWIGITGQRRSWIEQVEGYGRVVQKLSQRFHRLLIVIDGWTARESKFEPVPEDQRIFDAIASQFRQSGVTYMSAIGLDFKKKIQICQQVDAFVANAGGGCLVPYRFCKKPGVLHSNSKIRIFKGFSDDFVKDVQTIDQEGSASVQKSTFISYHADWSSIYDDLSSIVSSQLGVDIDVTPKTHT